MKIILGIDPGLTCTGWSIVQFNDVMIHQQQNQMTYVASGIIKPLLTNCNLNSNNIITNKITNKITGLTSLDIQTSSSIQSLQQTQFQTLKASQKSIKNDFLQRALQIFTLLQLIIKQYSPNYCAIENTYVNTAHANYFSALKLSQARAIAMIACATLELDVSEYQAKTIKKTLTGSGDADKSQILKAIKLYLPKISKTITNTNEGDAIAIALCHAYHIR